MKTAKLHPYHLFALAAAAFVIIAAIVLAHHGQAFIHSLK